MKTPLLPVVWNSRPRTKSPKRSLVHRSPAGSLTRVPSSTTQPMPDCWPAAEVQPARSVPSKSGRLPLSFGAAAPTAASMTERTTERTSMRRRGTALLLVDAACDRAAERSPWVATLALLGRRNSIQRRSTFSECRSRIPAQTVRHRRRNPAVPPLGRDDFPVRKSGKPHRSQIRQKTLLRVMNVMPSAGSWITAALYFWGAYSCRATSIHLEVGLLEPRAWTAIAVLLVLLGITELLQLQSALTNFGRSTAFEEGWYWHRQDIQAALTEIGAAITVVLGLGLLLYARRTSLECGIALACAAMIVGFIFVRAVSLHAIDAVLLRTTFGLHWSRIPELAGSVIILLSSLSRRF